MTTTTSVGSGMPVPATGNLRPPTFTTDEVDVEGVRLEEAAEKLGKSLSATLSWMASHGFRDRSSGTFSRAKSAEQVEAAITRRLATARPSAPCFRCGAARGCEHRSATAGLHR